MRIWGVWLSFMLATTCMSEAAWVQYQVSTGFVTGGPAASAFAFPAAPDRDAIEDPALDVTNPVWPVPAGCPSGARAWTQLSPGNTLPLLARTDLALFSTTSTLLTGCHEVGRWRELDQLVTQAIIDGAASQQAIAVGLNAINVPFLALCINVDGQGDLVWSGNANCLTWQTNLATLNVQYQSRANYAALTTQMVTLVTEACAFRSAQGWGTCN